LSIYYYEKIKGYNPNNRHTSDAADNHSDNRFCVDLLYIHNIGTDTLDTGADVDEDRIMVSGSCYGNDTAAPWDEYITYDPPTLGPGDSGIANDWHCNSSDDGTARYTLIAGGRVQKVQVSC
jgi:hypothetical protein